MKIFKRPRNQASKSAGIVGRRALVFLCVLGCLIGPIAAMEAWLKGHLASPSQVYIVLLLPTIVIASIIAFRVLESARRLTGCFLAVSYGLIVINAIVYGDMIGGTAIMLAGWAAIAILLSGFVGGLTAVPLAVGGVALAAAFPVHILEAYGGTVGGNIGYWVSFGTSATLLLTCVGGAVLRLHVNRANRQMEDAKQQAAAADQTKSQFLANISHEIRTPVNGVVAMAELLSKTKLDAEQQVFTEIIAKSGNSVAVTISNILDIAQLETGQLDLASEPFAVEDAFEDTAVQLASKAAEKDIDLIVRISPTLPRFLTGDCGRLQQITRNLIDNAIKFTDDGQVFLDVDGEIHQGTAANIAKLNIRVTDTGNGIPAGKRHLLFKKFSQIDISETQQHDGTGLGLAVSAELVRHMGGEIGFEESAEGGSVFWFKLPMIITEQSSKSQSAERHLVGARVLIVDANATSQSAISEQMQTWGHESAAVNSCREAVAFLIAANDRGLNVDCVVINEGKHDLDSARTTAALSRNMGDRQIPVVVLMSSISATDAKTISSVNISASLIKPVRAALLRSTITRVVAEAQEETQKNRAADRAA